MNTINLEEDVKRFKEIMSYETPKQSLNEYTFITKPQLNEEGDEDDEQQEQPAPQDAQQPQAMGGGNNAPQQPPMGGNAPMPQDGGQGAPDASMGQPPMDMGGQAPDMGGDMGGQAPDMGGEPMPDIDPMAGEVPEEDGIETEEMEEGDEVIDVDDLTKSQEATEYKIDGVDDRIAALYKTVEKLSNVIMDNADELKSLRDEFAKRNPTDKERMNIRSMASTPFNDNPQEYWERFADTHPNYDITFDNDINPADEEKEYEIRQSDIDGIDMKEIADTLNVNQDLRRYIGF